MLFEYKLEDNIVDNPALPREEIQKYDMDICYEEVLKKINEFITLQVQYPNIPKPRITSNYEVRYECFIKSSNDKVGNYIAKKCDTEMRMQALYSEISLALSTLSRDEFTYFLDVLYLKKSENYLIDKIQTTRHLFKTIKASCIVKMAIALNVSAYS